MNDNNRSQSIWLTVAMVLAGIGLQFFPSRYVNQIERIARDAMKPGQLLALEGWNHLIPAVEDDHKLSAREDANNWKLRTQIAACQEKLHRLNSELASLRQVQKTPPLFLPVTVEARILSAAQIRQLAQGFVIGAGGDRGFNESELVVTDDGLKIDLGNDQQVESDSLLLATGTVIGSIKHVGRWSSSVRRVTDDGFRTSVRLLRCTETDCVFGANGSLHGHGKPTCSMQYVSASESVDVGDFVVTSSSSNGRGVVSKIGVVTTAELKPGAEFWEIEVTPAFDQKSPIPPAVLVLKDDTSTTRILTN